jgi:glutamine amidotransferase
MIAIVDYGVGNLFSLANSFAAIGAEAVVTADPAALREADKIVLPGVGAFRDAAEKLRESGLGAVVTEEAKNGKPLFGICLGMQLLFEKSYEYGEWEGLGLIPGEIRPIADVVPAGLKIPHMGWNALVFPRRTGAYDDVDARTAETPLPDGTAGAAKHPLFRYIDEGDCVYFVHSYYAAKCDANTIAVAEYGAPLTAAVAKGNVAGCQFHPEKSGNVGLAILRAFAER